MDRSAVKGGSKANIQHQLIATFTLITYREGKLKNSQRFSSQQQPLLSRFAVTRSGESNIPGSYSRERDVWVVNHLEKETPIVRVGGLPSELTTKTHNNNEEDDTTPYFHLELATKTDVQVERDDDDLSNSDVLVSLTKNDFKLGRFDKNSSKNHLLELLTKTEVNTESDDDYSCMSHVLELTTKTKVDSERDDDGDLT